jgi:hypothetical protein
VGKSVAQLESKILPSITMKGFAIDEDQQAIEWLKEK